jgi:hypothetical protein
MGLKLSLNELLALTILFDFKLLAANVLDFFLTGLLVVVCVLFAGIDVPDKFVCSVFR